MDVEEESLRAACSSTQTPWHLVSAVIWMLSSSVLGDNSQPLRQIARCAAQGLAFAGKQRRTAGQAALSALPEPRFPSRPPAGKDCLLCAGREEPLAFKTIAGGM